MPALPPPITSRTNARVKALRQALSGEARQAGELVAVEGGTLIGEALRSGLPLEQVYVREGNELPADLWARLSPEQVIVLSASVFDHAVDTRTPQGLAATLRIPAWPAANPQALRGLVLVLEDVQDPGNLGTLLRSAEAFGVVAAFLTHGCANPWGPKVVRASAGSVFRVPTSRAAIGDTLRDLQAEGVACVAAVAGSEEAVAAPVARLASPVALVIGNEGKGLSAEVLALANSFVHIPCRTESLNAAVAGSVLLYEAQRQNAGAPEGTRGA